MSGYEFNGCFHTHPARYPAFWTKELLLDLLGTGVVFPQSWAPPDRQEYTPVGLKSWQGFLRSAGLDEDAYSLSLAVPVFRKVFALRSKYGHKSLIDELHDA